MKNKAPNPLQITAEQLLREAQEFKDEAFVSTKSTIVDKAELEHYRATKRKEFETTLQRVKQKMDVWIAYGRWETAQHEYDRARSIYERALDVDHRNVKIWLEYTDMEMKNKFINHARNVWDRAVTLLPREDQLWYKYAHMEEMVGNVVGARAIFERWMQWEPTPNSWNSYLKMEVRHENFDKAEQVFERYLVVHNTVDTYLKYSRFLHKYGGKENIIKARKVYERAMHELQEEANDPKLFIAFAEFEEMCGEFDRARVIYKYSLDNVSKKEAEVLYERYTSFEKQRGSTSGLEDVINSKRRFEYEEELKLDSYNYDTWFDYLRMEESAQEVDKEKVRELYERAICNVPPIPEKRFWKRYIYLWINYALFEELDCNSDNLERVRQIWGKCLEVIPHSVFTFSKVWVMAGHLELREKRLDAFRKLMGVSLGKCPRKKTFQAYIEVELQLGNIDRCRTLYQKYVELMPTTVEAWSRFAQLETSLAELDRARAIYELATQQPVLDVPELLWKNYIDLETKAGEYGRTEQLFVRLLEKTKHVKVWISRAAFHASIGRLEQARAAFVEADGYFKKEQEKKEQRLVLLEAWRDFEKKHGDEGTHDQVLARLPKKVKKRRRLQTADGEEAGWEEYVDYLYPDEEVKTGRSKLMEKARMWKKKKADGDEHAEE